MKKPNIHTAQLAWLIVVAVSLLPLISLLHPGLPVTHDGQDHVARIANFYRSLTEGNIAPRWAANLNWGFGHPILMFLYPLPSYFASLFHAFGWSFVDSTKLVFAAGFVMSISAMYLWAAAEWGMVSGLVAAVLYGFAPYRFTDLYVRGAIGEHMAFVFLPLILFGFRMLARRRAGTVLSYGELMRGEGCIAFGTAALILSHNAMSIMFLPVIALYAAYLYFRPGVRKTRFVLEGAGSVAFGFLFSAFFWFPAYFEGKYTLRDIVTADPLTGRFVPPYAFIYSPWSYGGSDQLSKSVGLAQLAVLFGAIVSLVKNRRQPMMWGALGIFALSIVMMTGVSAPVWEYVRLLQKFQFPWRFLSVSVFSVAVLGAVLVHAQKTGKKILAFVLVCVAILGTAGMWHPQRYKTYPESFFTGIYNSTTDTGESSPIWSVRFMEKRPAVSMAVISGEGKVKARERTTTSHAYSVSAATDMRLVENTLYFPGWQIAVDGTPVPLEFQDPSFRGLMTFTVPTGEHDISVTFTETRLRRFADVVSAASLLVAIAALGTIPIWRKKQAA